MSLFKKTATFRRNLSHLFSQNIVIFMCCPFVAEYSKLLDEISLSLSALCLSIFFFVSVCIVRKSNEILI